MASLDFMPLGLYNIVNGITKKMEEILMKEPMYTVEQAKAADRLMEAVASVPKEKQPAFIRFIEAVAIGAELAARNSA